jgi:hypothetical protein
MTSTTQAAPQAPPATAAHPNPNELRDQIKQSILAAQDAARQAAIEGAAVTAPRGARTIRVTDGQSDNVYGAQGPTRIVYSGADGNNSGQDFPPQVADISVAFFIMCAVMVIGWPLARAFGKRLERRNDVPQVNAGTSQQLQRIEQAVEAMAIEVERISESQRFLAKLQNAQAPSRELKSS